MSEPGKKTSTIYHSEEEFKKRFDFDTSKVLGEGGFAKVYKAFDKQFDEYVALKFQNADNLNKYDIIREVKTSRKLSHKNIIRVHEAHVIKTDRGSFGSNEVQVGVLEFAEGGTLYDYIKTQRTEDEFREIFYGVLDGLEFLHNEKKLIHRDLSFDNILIFKENDRIVPKLADFGISKNLHPTQSEQKKSTQLVGKVEYMAPEQFSADKFGLNGKISTNVDLWSFGVILYELFTEKTPFVQGGSDNPMSVMHNICNKSIPKDVNQIPEPYCTVIKKCLVKQASQRVQSASEVKQIFNNYAKPKKRIKSKYIVMAILILVALSAGIFMVNFTSIFNKMGFESQGVVAESSSIKKLENYFVEFTDINRAYEDKRSLIDPIITECFSGEEAQVETLVNQTSVNMKNIRQFLLNSLARDVKGIEIISSQEDANKKIINLSVSIQN